MLAVPTVQDFVHVLPLFITVCLAYYLYKISSHPLSTIPGPLAAKLSPARLFYHAWIGDLHVDHARCHQKYGSVYRSAPSRVVFNSLSAALAIYTTDRSILKAAGYASHPWTRQQIPSLFNCIDPFRAAMKKKIIRPNTLAPAIALQHRSIEANVETMMQIIKANPTKDMSQLCFYYALDVISQSMFGASFNCMRYDSNRWMAPSLETGNRYMYLQLAWPSIFQWLTPWLDHLAYPDFQKDSKKFLQLCQNAIKQGEELGHKSIYNLMLADLPEGVSDEECEVDAYSFMRGGGDMVAVTIAATLFFVTQDSRILESLTSEILSTFSDEQPPSTGARLDSCRYLRACVDEALRMAPPGPGVFWRTSASDLIIDGIPLPAGTDFGVSIFALHYNEEVFPDPLVFRPERFLNEGAREHFMPFARGFRACPAQKLAYPTILLPIARLLWEFEAKPTKTQAEIYGSSHIIKKVYEQVFGSIKMPSREIKREAEEKELFLQTDKFGSSIQGPILNFKPRKR